ncbi:MAG: hypothetical protein ACK56I_36345, partial [bacterium]
MSATGSAGAAPGADAGTPGAGSAGSGLMKTSSLPWRPRAAAKRSAAPQADDRFDLDLELRLGARVVGGRSLAPKVLRAQRES